MRTTPSRASEVPSLENPVRSRRPRSAAGGLPGSRAASRAAAAVLLLVATPAARAQVCSTVRASVASDGSQSGPNVGQMDLSTDGRYVVFTTSASNFFTTNGWYQVGRHDLATGATILVSADPNGGPSLGSSETPRVSADGRYVAWPTTAHNLTPGDDNPHWDVYLHDVETGENWLVSRTLDGTAGNASSFNPSISADGRYVAFTSAVSDLVAGDTNGAADVFVFDRVAGTVERVSTDAAGAQGDLFSVGASISADGRYVAFESLATVFHPADVNGSVDVFVKDRATGAVTMVTVRPDGLPANYGGNQPSISGDGRFVAFSSTSTDLGPADWPLGGTTDVFLRDLQAATTSVVDRSVLGLPVVGSAEHPDLSYDGRFVAFESTMSELVIGDTNGQGDVFLHDRARNETRRVDVDDAFLQAGAYSGRPAVSDDGTRVGFLSVASNLVPGDTNGVFDAFVRICPLASGAAFCSGDGSATACPCGNSGALGSGCANGSQAYGGRLYALGTASVAADTLELRGEGLPASFITYFQGTTAVAGGLGSVFGDGLLCAGGSLVRLGTVFSGGGVSGYPSVGDLAISVKGQIPPGAGVVRTYQGWYRNAAAFCTADTFNLTNGLEITWLP